MACRCETLRPKTQVTLHVLCAAKIKKREVKKWLVRSNNSKDGRTTTKKIRNMLLSESRPIPTSVLVFPIYLGTFVLLFVLLFACHWPGILCMYHFVSLISRICLAQFCNWDVLLTVVIIWASCQILDFKS
jgi:hypothetical protein